MIYEDFASILDLDLIWILIGFGFGLDLACFGLDSA